MQHDPQKMPRPASPPTPVPGLRLGKGLVQLGEHLDDTKGQGPCAAAGPFGGEVPTTQNVEPRRALTGAPPRHGVEAPLVLAGAMGLNFWAVSGSFLSRKYCFMGSECGVVV